MSLTLVFRDSFCLSKFQNFISGNSTRSDGTTYVESGYNIKLTNYFVAFLFSRIEAQKHNNLIDEYNHSGVFEVL